MYELLILRLHILMQLMFLTIAPSTITNTTAIITTISTTTNQGSKIRSSQLGANGT